jgi:hypothetical protein
MHKSYAELLSNISNQNGPGRHMVDNTAWLMSDESHIHTTIYQSFSPEKD